MKTMFTTMVWSDIIYTVEITYDKENQTNHKESQRLN